MSRKKKDSKLKKLLHALQKLIKKHGSRSEKVRKFVQRHKSVDEFVDLAAIVILAAENK